MSQRSLRLTWAWLWAGLALALLAIGAAAIAAIALAGSDRDEVELAVALIGFPALLGAFALGIMAVVAARPSVGPLRAVRRWVLALAGAVGLAGGIAAAAQGSQGALLLIAAGASVLVLLALDVRGGRGE